MREARSGCEEKRKKKGVRNVDGAREREPKEDGEVEWINERRRARRERARARINERVDGKMKMGK